MSDEEPQKHNRRGVVTWVGYALSAGWLVYRFLGLFL